MLLEAGADPEAREAAGATVLDEALWRGGDRGKEIVRLLVSHGARWTLRSASAFGSFEDVQRLLATGATVNQSDGRGGTALHYAATYNGTAVARALIAAGAEVQAVVYGDRRPLDCAVGSGNLEVARLLCDSGAAVNRPGRSPLHVAAMLGYPEVAALLLERKAQVNARDLEGATPLHLTAESGTAGSAVARLLLQAGAAVDAKDEAGRSPLHQAAYRGEAELAALLLAHGADVKAADAGGLRPVDYIRLGRQSCQMIDPPGFRQVEQVLRAHGG